MPKRNSEADGRKKDKRDPAEVTRHCVMDCQTPQQVGGYVDISFWKNLLNMLYTGLDCFPFLHYRRSTESKGERERERETERLEEKLSEWKTHFELTKRLEPNLYRENHLETKQCHKRSMSTKSSTAKTSTTKKSKSGLMPG